MTKKDWEDVKINSLKEYVIIYQRSRGKFGGRNKPAVYIELKIPKYSMKFGNYLEVSDSLSYHYKRIKEVKEL